MTGGLRWVTLLPSSIFAPFRESTQVTHNNKQGAQMCSSVPAGHETVTVSHEKFLRPSAWGFRDVIIQFMAREPNYILETHSALCAQRRHQHLRLLVGLLFSLDVKATIMCLVEIWHFCYSLNTSAYEVHTICKVGLKKKKLPFISTSCDEKLLFFLLLNFYWEYLQGHFVSTT